MGSLRARVAQSLRELVAASYGLRVDWSEMSASKLEAVLKELPDMPPWPREVYALLLRERGGVTKRIALITAKREPVALLGLRSNRGVWEPVTHWILPHALFPVRDGLLFQCLAAIGFPVRIGWWRWEALPPRSPLITKLHCGPRYSAKLDTNHEQYWRKSGNMDNVKSMRNRCKTFRLLVNLRGAAEWTIRNSEAKWRAGGVSQMPDLEDRLEVVKYLEDCGLHYTLTLMDGERPAGGHLFLADGKCLVWHTTYKDPSYDWHGVGVRLLDLAFQWGAESGFEELDVGGLFDYKKRWAPECGLRCEFETYHPVLRCLDQTFTPMFAMARSAKSWAAARQNR